MQNVPLLEDVSDFYWLLPQHVRLRRLLVVVVAKDAFPRTLAAGHNDPRQLAQTVLGSGWIQGRTVDSTVIAAYYDTPVDATMSLRVLSS